MNTITDHLLARAKQLDANTTVAELDQLIAELSAHADLLRADLTAGAR